MSRVDYLLTETEKTGGVQLYGRALVSAVDTLQPEPRPPSHAFSLNDPARPGRITGFGGRKLRFAAAAILVPWLRRADVVLIGHCHFSAFVLAYQVVRPRMRAYIVAHGMEIEAPLSALRRLGLRRADQVLCVSESTRRQVVEQQGVDPARTTVLYFGFDPGGSVGLTRKGSMPHGAPLLASVSRLIRTDTYKGIDTTIRALPQLIPRYPQVHYAVAGDGDDRARLEALAVELAVADHVTFLGEVTDRVRQELYAACDMFVLPSTREGLGIVYLEAMAAGKAVIGVHAGGVPDVVVHEANGLLVSRSDPDLVAAAISRLAGDDSLRRRLGAWGREHTVPRFSAARMRSALSNLPGL